MTQTTTTYEIDGMTFNVQHETAEEFNARVSAIRDYLGFTDVNDGAHCPVCGAINPTNKHLFDEHHSMLKGSFDQSLGRNAENALQEVKAMLLGRGLTHIPNIFGAMPIQEQAKQ
jgi:hypothetical protein